jgi:DNA-directed RNA polymerase specialized sigma24 family protein
MSGLSDKAKQAVREADLHEIVPRLLFWTIKAIKRRSWLGHRGGPLPGGLEAQDLVQQALTKLLTGERQWDPDKVDLLRFLMGAIRSEISNLVVGKENTQTRRIEDPIEGKQPIPNSPDIVLEAVHPSQWERGLFTADEDAKEREAILQLLKDDPKAERLAELIIDDDIDKPASLARLLGIPVTEIHAIKKRLRRKLRVLCRRSQAG